MTFLQKCIVIILVLSVFSSSILTVSADEQAKEYLDETFRINRADLTTEFEVNAVPGSMLNVRIYYDSGKTPEFNSSESVMENVAYVNQFNVPETGKVEFSFQNNERTGVYSLRLSGQVYNADLEILGDNSMPKAPSGGGLYAQFLNFDYTTLFPGTERYWTTAVTVQEWEDDADVYEYAKQIRGKLDKMQAGRRIIFLGGSWNDYFSEQNAENVIYLDNGAQYVHDKLDMFFEAFYEVGGTVDYVFTDFEIMGGSYTKEELAKIVSDPRYETKIRPLFEAYDWDFIDETHPYWEGSELDGIPHLQYIYDRVDIRIMNEVYSDYIDYACYQPAAKWFPDVKFSEYFAMDVYRWDDLAMFGLHNSYPGTHNAPEMYYRNGNGREYTMDFTYGNPYVIENFDLLANTMKRMYYIYAKDKDARVSPWLDTYGVNPHYDEASPYPNEIYLHSALYNPDPFMIFSVKLVAGGNFEYNVWKNDGVVISIMKYINDIIGESEPEDREVIDCGEPLHYKYYLLSGMRVKDRNIYRITPDLHRESELETLDDFVVSENSDGVKFAINGQTVTFPQGKIIDAEPDTEFARLGYWVETPANVLPVQEFGTSDMLNGELTANVKILSDRYGTEPKIMKKDEPYSFVMRYNNQQHGSQDFTVLIGEFDEDGNALSFKTVGQNSAAIGQYGRFVFNLPKLNEATHSIKIFAWDNLSKLKPLKQVTEIFCEN